MLKITIVETEEPVDDLMDAEIELWVRPIDSKKSTRYLCFTPQEGERAVRRAISNMLSKEEIENAEGSSPSTE